jgi:hypothetical protein
MTWLVTQKVMPSLLTGEPPDYLSILEDRRDELPVCWAVRWGDRRLGWAVNRKLPLPEGMTEVRSRIYFEELPLKDLVPAWLAALLPPLDELESQWQMETRSSLVFDPRGRLSRFDSLVQFSPGVRRIKVEGVIQGSLLSLSVHFSDLSYETELALPRKAMLSDALSPQTRLPGLRDGQSWTMEVYNPLRPPAPGWERSMQIVQVKVEGVEPVLWEGRLVDSWLVVCRGDPGDGLRGADVPRGRLWVHPDGRVLKQEVTVVSSTLTFVRLGDEQAAALAESLAKAQAQGIGLPTAEYAP